MRTIPTNSNSARLLDLEILIFTLRVEISHLIDDFDRQSIWWDLDFTDEVVENG